MGRSSSALLTLLVVSCIAAGAVASIEDGIPRPANCGDAPTTAYGPVPELMTSDEDCEWYGFANLLYPGTATLSCLDEMRAALTNAEQNPPSALRPFLYYTLPRMIDQSTNQSRCYHGCFNLAASARAPGSDVPAPIFSPVPAPMYYDGPAEAPVAYGAPAFAPASGSGMD